MLLLRQQIKGSVVKIGMQAYVPLMSDMIKVVAAVRSVQGRGYCCKIPGEGNRTVAKTASVDTRVWMSRICRRFG